MVFKSTEYWFLKSIFQPKNNRKNQQENQYQHQYFQKNPQETTQETILFCLTARATCGLKAHTFCQGAPMLWKLFFYKGSFLQALCQGKPLAKAFCWPKPFCQPNILLSSGPFAKGVPARRFLFVKGICQDPLVKVCLVGKELTLLPRKDFVSRMSKGMPFGQGISMLGSQCTLSNPSLTSWRCRSTWYLSLILEHSLVDLTPCTTLDPKVLILPTKSSDLKFQQHLGLISQELLVMWPQVWNFMVTWNKYLSASSAHSFSQE